LNITAATNASVVRQQATGTIVDAANFGLSIGDTAVQQGVTPNVNVPVYLSAASNHDVHFTVRTVDDTAVAGTDYTAANSTITYTIPAVMLSKTVPIPILTPSGNKPNRTFHVLLNSADVNFIQPTGNVTIFATGALPTITAGELLFQSKAFT